MPINVRPLAAAALVLLPAATVALRAAPDPSPTNVCYVVSYDHGGLVLWGYEHFLENFRTLLGWLDRHPKLRMGLDNEAWM